MKNYPLNKRTYEIFGGNLPEKPLFEWVNNIVMSPYNPLKLFDTVMDDLGIHTHLALSKELQYHSSEISKIIHQNVAISYKCVLRIHEMTGMPIIDIRALMGDDGNRCFYPPVKITDKL